MAKDTIKILVVVLLASGMLNKTTLKLTTVQSLIVDCLVFVCLFTGCSCNNGTDVTGNNNEMPQYNPGQQPNLNGNFEFVYISALAAAFTTCIILVVSIGVLAGYFLITRIFCK